MSHINIHLDNSTECELLFLLLLLNTKENDLLDQFDNNSMVKLELDVDLASMSG